jgi:hypothetical protein
MKAMSSVGLSRKLLFGGAISLTLPEFLKDASEIRHVPDHQEMFFYPESNQSIIFELLEQEDIPDEDAIIKHFNELKSFTGAASSKINSLLPFDYLNLAIKDSSSFYLIGEHSFKESDVSLPNLLIRIQLILVRLKNVQTDFLISFSTPVITEVYEFLDESTFINCVSSLRIEDWNLFK